jgi:hypothetical protein
MIILGTFALISRINGGGMGNKRNSTNALVIVISFCMLSTMYATIDMRDPLQDAIEQEMFIVGSYPKVEEIFELVYRVRLKPNAQESPEQRYYVKFFSVAGKVDLMVDKTFFISHWELGEWKEFHCECRISEICPAIRVNAMLRREGAHYGMVGEGIKLYLVDRSTGQYGTLEEVRSTPEKNPELFYDPAQDVTYPPDEYVDIYTQQRNREWLDEVEEIQAGLTKWEKLHLLHDVLHYPVRGTVKMTDLEAAQEFLDAGWLDAYQAGPDAREKWLEDFYKKSRSNSNHENPGK